MKHIIQHVHNGVTTEDIVFLFVIKISSRRIAHLYSVSSTCCNTKHHGFVIHTFLHHSNSINLIYICIYINISSIFIDRWSFDLYSSLTPTIVLTSYKMRWIKSWRLLAILTDWFSKIQIFDQQFSVISLSF